MLLPNENPLHPKQPAPQEHSTESEPLHILREFKARSLVIEEVTEAQFLKIATHLSIPLPQSALQTLFQAIERGESPILPTIIRDFTPDAAALISSACGWQVVTDGIIRPFVECVFTLLEGEHDLRNLEVVLHRGVRKGKLLLEIRYDERLLAQQYRCPDRWSVFDGILESADLMLPKHGNWHRADTSHIEVTPSTHITLHHLEQDRPQFMRDRHLALRPELLSSILGADENKSLLARIDCLRSQILGGCEFRRTEIIQCQGSLANHQREIESAQKKSSLVLVVCDDLVVPVTRAVSFETLRIDFDKLLSIREKLVQCPDPMAVTRPLQVSVHHVDAQRINSVLCLAGYHFPLPLVESIENYLLRSDSIAEDLVGPLLSKPSEFILRSESAVEISREAPPTQSRMFSVESPGCPRVGIFAMFAQSGHDTPREATSTIEEFGGSGEPVDPEGLSPAETYLQPGELEPPGSDTTEDIDPDEKLEAQDARSWTDDQEQHEEGDEMDSEPFSSGTVTRLEENIAIEALTIAIQWPVLYTSPQYSPAIRRWGIIEEICRQMGMVHVPRKLANPVAVHHPTIDGPWRVAVTKRLIPELILREA